jgi:chromosome segregation ATPase
MLQTKFKPERLNDKKLQQHINEALDYRSRIEKGVREQSDSVLKDELTQTASQIDDWLENMYDLARRIDRYQQEREILHRDRVRAESRMGQLNAEFAQANNPAVKEQIQTTLNSLQRQLQTLETLEGTIQRARLQLENSLTHLGTIYSQTMLVAAKDIDRSSARRLRHEIAEEVTELNDLLLSMNDVYAQEGIG